MQNYINENDIDFNKLIYTKIVNVNSDDDLDINNKLIFIRLLSNIINSILEYHEIDGNIYLMQVKNTTSDEDIIYNFLYNRNINNLAFLSIDYPTNFLLIELVKNNLNNIFNDIKGKSNITIEHINDINNNVIGTNTPENERIFIYNDLYFIIITIFNFWEHELHSSVNNIYFSDNLFNITEENNNIFKLMNFYKHSVTESLKINENFFKLNNINKNNSIINTENIKLHLKDSINIDDILAYNYKTNKLEIISKYEKILSDYTINDKLNNKFKNYYILGKCCITSKDINDKTPRFYIFDNRMNSNKGYGWRTYFSTINYTNNKYLNFKPLNTWNIEPIYDIDGYKNSKVMLNKINLLNCKYDMNILKICKNIKLDIINFNKFYLPSYGELDIANKNSKFIRNYIYDYGPAWTSTVSMIDEIRYSDDVFIYLNNNFGIMSMIDGFDSRHIFIPFYKYDIHDFI